MIFYKVENCELELNQIVDTDKHYYFKHLQKEFNLMKPHLDKIIEVADNIYLGIDIPVCIYNNLALNALPYIQSVLNEKELIPLQKVTGNQVYKNSDIKKETLLTFIDQLGSDEMPLFRNGTFLWEYIFDIVRQNKFQNILSRYDSSFCFVNKNDCIKYENESKKTGFCYEIEIIENRGSFIGDMSYMDMIENHNSLDKIKEYAENYFSGKKSKEPIEECYFKGKYKINKRLTTAST